MTKNKKDRVIIDAGSIKLDANKIIFSGKSFVPNQFSKEENTNEK